MLFLVAAATLLIVYVIYALAKGEIYALGLIDREESPEAFWKVAILYGAVGIALLALS